MRIAGVAFWVFRRFVGVLSRPREGKDFRDFTQKWQAANCLQSYQRSCCGSDFVKYSLNGEKVAAAHRGARENSGFMRGDVEE